MKIKFYFVYLVLFIADIIEHTFSSLRNLQFSDNEDFPGFNASKVADAYGMKKDPTDSPSPVPPPTPPGSQGADLSVDEARSLTANPTEFITKMKDDAVVKWDGQTLTKAQLAEKFKVQLTGGAGDAGAQTGDKVKIGGKDFTLPELEAEGVKYYKEKLGLDVDLSKMSEEQRNNFVLDYTKMAHVNAWKGSMGDRENKIGDDKRNMEAERAQFMNYKADEDKKLNDRKIELSRKEYELKMLLAQDENDQKLTDEQRDKLIADKAVAKNELGSIQIENHAIDGQKVAIVIDRNIRALQLEYPELRTSVDIDEVTRRFLAKDPALPPEDVSKMLAITEIVQTSRLFKQNPSEYYSLKRKYMPGANGNNNGSSNNNSNNNNSSNNNNGVPSGRDANNSIQSLEEQIKTLRKKQNENPTISGGAGAGAANLGITGDKNVLQNPTASREEKLRALGY